MLSLFRLRSHSSATFTVIRSIQARREPGPRIGKTVESTVNLQERIVHQVFGGRTVARITEADGQQTACIAVIQLTTGRIIPFSAPLGQYLLLHSHICVHLINGVAIKRLHGTPKIFMPMQYSAPPCI